MIEQAIYFVLGCVVTALAALAFAPLFWHRALRLTRARLQLQVPLSMQEILAERDQLRAEFAVEHLKAEQAMERIRAGKTRDMATIGRQRVAATAAADQIAALRRLGQAQEEEVLRLMGDLETARAEAGAIQIELHDAHGLVDRWRAQADRDATARAALRREADDKRTFAAALETRLAGLESRLLDAQHAGEAREHGLRGRLEMAMAQSARHETSGLSLRRDLDEARQRIRTLEHELEAHAGQGGAAQAGHETGDDLLRENASLRDALAQLRGADPDQRGDDAGLRASIHALGLAVARMGDAQIEAAAPEPQTPRQQQPSPIDAA